MYMRRVQPRLLGYPLWGTQAVCNSRGSGSIRRHRESTDGIDRPASQHPTQYIEASIATGEKRAGT